MSPQEQHVLDAFYQNAAMGADATSAILPKADHPALRQELCKQLEFYQSRKDEIRSQMQQAHMQPASQNEMAKFWAKTSIQLHCLGGAPSGEIAKLMLKGTNTGVIQLTEVLHSNPDISERLMRQGKSFVRHEEAYMERLKAYL